MRVKGHDDGHGADGKVVEDIGVNGEPRDPAKGAEDDLPNAGRTGSTQMPS
jgi:hypothetical protein